jgi:hypothetical protein
VQKEAQVLKSPGDTPSSYVVGREPKKALFPKKDFALVGMVDTRDAIEHGGLSRPIGADDGKDLPIFHPEVHPGQGHNASKADSQLIQLEQRHILEPGLVNYKVRDRNEFSLLGLGEPGAI